MTLLYKAFHVSHFATYELKAKMGNLRWHLSGICRTMRETLKNILLAIIGRVSFSTWFCFHSDIFHAYLKEFHEKDIQNYNIVKDTTFYTYKSHVETTRGASMTMIGQAWKPAPSSANYKPC